MSATALALSVPSLDVGRLGRLAVASLHAELVCAPKPGLVTPFDTGSHDDMDAATFMRSLFALRGYFVAIAEAGARDAPFEELQRLGIAAEGSMSRATRGINTHRGAIFSLGLLTASAASLGARGASTSPEIVCAEVGERWGAGIRAATPAKATSPGHIASRRYGAGDARREAIAGFPTLRAIAVPALSDALCAGASQNAAMVHALMAIVAATDDTNLLHRGGRDGLSYAQARAREFVEARGVFASDWRPRLARIASGFVARRLSPGGSADLLACAWFLLRVARAAR